MIIFCTRDSACLKFGGVFLAHYSLLVNTVAPENTLTIFIVFGLSFLYLVFSYF